MTSRNAVSRELFDVISSPLKLTLKGLLRAHLTVSLLLIGSLWAQNPPTNAIVGFSINSNNIPSGIEPTFDQWLWNNFNLVIDGGAGMSDMNTYKGPNNAWTTYVDGCCIYVPDIYAYVLSTAAGHSWPDPEGPLLHMSMDYVPAAGYSGIDQFDAYEELAGSDPGNPENARNGIFTLVGSTYTDVTVQAYCPTTTPKNSCASYPPNPVTVSDRLLIGLQTPFDTVNFTINTGRSGGSVSWKYWNGSGFAPLTLASDTTGGLVSTGTTIFPPPSNWVPSVVNGSQSKYWVEVAVSGASTDPILGKVYGDNLITASGGTSYNRGWKPLACVSGHINIGTPVEYCAVPASGSTARFRQQARALGYGANVYNDVWGNPGNSQSSQTTWAYVEQARTAADLLYPGMFGVMFDNAGPTPQQTPSFSAGNSDLGASSMIIADGAMYASLHTILTTQYGTFPKFWDGVNSYQPSSNYAQIFTAMNWAFSEEANLVENNYSMDTNFALTLCTDSTWCPGSPTTNNPNGTVGAIQVINNQQFGLFDYNVVNGQQTCLSCYHHWDMAERGPMNALAMKYMVQNSNTLFAYDPAGEVYSGYDDYYYWVMSSRTLASNISSQTCYSGCSIPLSGPLETTTCPGTETEACPLRIGGTDVEGVTSYSGSTLTTITHTSGVSPILDPKNAGATIEYAVRSHQSQDHPLHTPLAMYGFFVPGSAIYLGEPDSTNGFDHPCTKSSVVIDGGCIWMSGPLITGNSACAPLHCSPLLRRDFGRGTYGKAIVLMRPVTYQNTVTASTEYDTYSRTISLGGTFYQVFATGTVSSTPITTTTLRGGESGIFVTSDIPILIPGAQ